MNKTAAKNEGTSKESPGLSSDKITKVTCPENDKQSMTPWEKKVHLLTREIPAGVREWLICLLRRSTRARYMTPTIPASTMGCSLATAEVKIWGSDLQLVTLRKNARDLT